MEEMNAQVKIVLEKQCEIVGARYEDVDFNDDLWFFSYQWTKDQEYEFIEWLTNHLQTDREARNNIMNIPSRNRRICRQAAQSFAFNFGWKYKE